MAAWPSPYVSLEEFPGEYESTHKSADETLTVQADGAYHHEFRPHEGEGYSYSGTWRHFYVNGSLAVSFEGFIVAPRPDAFFEKDRTVDPNGGWDCVPERDFITGDIHLGLNSDDGYYFYKTD